MHSSRTGYEVATLPAPPGGLVPRNALIPIVVPPTAGGTASVPYAVTPAQLLEATVAGNLTPSALAIGTSYVVGVAAPVAPRGALAIQNRSAAAVLYLFFGPTAPADDTASWPLQPGASWPPSGVSLVSQDIVFMRASAPSTPVTVLVG